MPPKVGSLGRPAVSRLPGRPGSLVRLLVREGRPAATALSVLSALADEPRHEFWPDDVAHSAGPQRSRSYRR
jgi:hypothetical protein